MNHNLTQTHPGVWRLVAQNPSPMTGPGTNTYLVGDGQMVIIDPGPNQATHLHHILEAVQQLKAQVQVIIVTHFHSDHAGCADRLADELGVPLLSFDIPLRHGDKIEVGQTTLEVLHTPGHIYTHICLLQVEQQLLFTGDLVAGQGTIVIIPPDGNMTDYLDSLRAMKALAVAAILPGHGPVVENPSALLLEYIDHRLEREQQILHCLGRGLTAAADIAAHISAGRPSEVMSIATLQVEAHLEKLRKEGRL